MRVFYHTDIGKVRTQNEDSIYTSEITPGVWVAVVADGMGGHLAGEVASKMITEQISKCLNSQNINISSGRRGLLQQTIEEANQTIFQLATSSPEYQGMGTTVVAAVVDHATVTVVHAGDSRAYLWDNESLRHVTEDHSYVNLLLRHGEITESEARHHPQRNMIINAVGTTEHIDTDAVDFAWQRSEMLLLCSDGLTSETCEEEIAEVLAKPEFTLEEKGMELFHLAMREGKDNISLILMQNEEV